MKFLLLPILFFSIPVFAQELSGSIWALSGVGCRNSSLEPGSHISKSLESSDVTAGLVYFVDGTNVNIKATVQGREESDSGTYSVNGNEISLSSLGNDTGTIFLVEDRLVIIGSKSDAGAKCCGVYLFENWRGIRSQIEAEGQETWEEHKRRHNLKVDEWTADNREELEQLSIKCQNETPFVYVLGKVN